MTHLRASIATTGRTSSRIGEQDPLALSARWAWIDPPGPEVPIGSKQLDGREVAVGGVRDSAHLAYWLASHGSGGQERPGEQVSTTRSWVSTLEGMNTPESADSDVEPDVTVLRADDPRCRDLEAAGYRLVGESWGARLRLPTPQGLALQQAAVARVQALGFTVLELGPAAAEALHRLEAANHPDYPFTPATAHHLRDPGATRALWADGKRIFGALDKRLLVAATVIGRTDRHGETEFTSVLGDYRGRGIGQAVKAASILALASEGVVTFGTGGAGLNEASLRANRALGYVLEERWRSYQRD
jgi:GNAT superfamily N-acetyltransferase